MIPNPLKHPLSTQLHTHSTSIPSTVTIHSVSLMANTPEPSLLENTTTDFRAPPPSPVASTRRSSVTNDEVLTEFLEHSLKVPNLILPDRVFPKQKSISSPPKLDLDSLPSLDKGKVKELLDSVGQIGCFQVINHGVPRDLIESAVVGGGGIFRIPPEKRKKVTRSAERVFGFEEGHGEDDDQEMSEEFVWWRDERLRLDMEGVWPQGYSNFREKLEELSHKIEMVADKILQFIWENAPRKWHENGELMGEDSKYSGPLCYIKKHSVESDNSDEGLRHDVIRTLIRGSEFSHFLCVHCICNGCEEFHIYSKRGWASFKPHQDALIVTIGDRLQAWSGGQYKHVIGRAVFKGTGDDDYCISMALLYTPPEINTKMRDNNISLTQQLIILLLFIIIYNLWICVCHK